MSDTAKWYVVHTYSGYENKVATSIENAVENRKLHDLIQEIRVPTETVVEIKDDKKREVERKLFPSYVLVKMIMTDDSWYVVRNIRGVTGFVAVWSSESAALTSFVSVYPFSPSTCSFVMFSAVTDGMDSVVAHSIISDGNIVSSDVLTR